MCDETCCRFLTLCLFPLFVCLQPKPVRRDQLLSLLKEYVNKQQDANPNSAAEANTNANANPAATLASSDNTRATPSPAHATNQLASLSPTAHTQQAHSSPHPPQSDAR